MEYILIIILQILGIGFHVGQKILVLDNKFADDSLHDVFNQFWNSDRVTVFISALVLILDLVVHFIIDFFAPTVREWEYDGVAGLVNYFTVSFTLALVFGYGGQRLIYKALGKAEEELTKKVEGKLIV